MKLSKSSRANLVMNIAVLASTLGPLGLVLCTGGSYRPIARTVVDIAIAACESFAAQDEGNLGGLRPSDWCAIASNAQPFIDGLLSASHKAGLMPPVYK